MPRLDTAADGGVDESEDGQSSPIEAPHSSPINVCNCATDFAPVPHRVLSPHRRLRLVSNLPAPLSASALMPNFRPDSVQSLFFCCCPNSVRLKD